jgi:hypothetical protein
MRSERTSFRDGLALAWVERGITDRVNGILSARRKDAVHGGSLVLIKAEMR